MNADEHRSEEKLKISVFKSYSDQCGSALNLRLKNILNIVGDTLMKLIAITLACIALTLVVVACTETAPPPTNSATPTAAASPTKPVDEFASARANFQKHCEACHGEKGEGGLAKVEEKRIKVPSLKAAHAIKHTDEQLTKMITNGEEEMPAFKDKLKAEEIAAMVRFVRKEFQGK